MTCNAFVLGGGGVLGAAEAGMARALVEAGVRPDLVCGTSIGAINGGAIAVDLTRAGVERLLSMAHARCYHCRDRRDECPRVGWNKPGRRSTHGLPATPTNRTHEPDGPACLDGTVNYA
ncbi:putative esterase of the alpha-beta hydrolase superfamily [Mycobacterium sp. JS623]|uniref:patatin-like phospholipase family protein n=1 Tax=Mycobacterium sp. JS623 TaxID=212767 RepID=UPI0002A55FE5|nr:putative esterase of the alpha-beta hydrolase superfamily [Mycobacterium sp. JS623]